MSSDLYDHPIAEARWLDEQRARVHRYLESEGVDHRGVSSEPAWFVAPYVAVWTVESKAAKGAVGWWAISGDLPTDYLSGHDARDARGALAAFATRWREVAKYLLRDEQHPTITIGRGGPPRELGDLLQTRARILEDWANDEGIW